MHRKRKRKVSHGVCDRILTVTWFGGRLGLPVVAASLPVALVLRISWRIPMPDKYAEYEGGTEDVKDEDVPENEGTETKRRLKTERRYNDIKSMEVQGDNARVHIPVSKVVDRRWEAKKHKLPAHRQWTCPWRFYPGRGTNICVVGGLHALAARPTAVDNLRAVTDARNVRANVEKITFWQYGVQIVRMKFKH
ncbi:hypothetical protein BJ912DRAFT_1047127 [Pholiota molesta]|nr:hypothetical protein BJ912DRAFT_1047127 [Pholiota molesta]